MKLRFPWLLSIVLLSAAAPAQQPADAGRPIAGLQPASARIFEAPGRGELDAARPLRNRLDDFIARRRGAIDRILAHYGVPRTQEHAP